MPLCGASGGPEGRSHLDNRVTALIAGSRCSNGEIARVAITLHVPKCVDERGCYDSWRCLSGRNVLPITLDANSTLGINLLAIHGNPATRLHISQVKEPKHGVNVGLEYFQRLLPLPNAEYRLLFVAQELLPQVVKHVERRDRDFYKAVCLRPRIAV